MIKKPVNRAGLVDGNILMQGPSRQPISHNPGRGHRARGHQDSQPLVLLQYSFDQGQYGHHLTDRGSVHPNEGPIGTG